MLRRIGDKLVGVWDLSASKPADNKSDAPDPKVAQLQMQLAGFADKLSAFDSENKSYINCVESTLLSFETFVKSNIDDLTSSQTTKGWDVKPEFGDYFKDIFEAAFDCGDVDLCFDVINKTFDDATDFLKRLTCPTEEFGVVSMATVRRNIKALYYKNIEIQGVELEEDTEFCKVAQEGVSDKTIIPKGISVALPLPAVSATLH